MDEKVRLEISGYKSKISGLQSQLTKLANQVWFQAISSVSWG
jgi:hypothetical protein